MISIIENIWLGLLITALPGAVFFEVLRRQFHDRTSVVTFLYGNFVGVIVIAMLALVGMSVATDFIQHKLFFVLSGLVLMYIGLLSVVRPRVKSAPSSRRGKAFTTGLVLSLANPISVVFWVTMVGSFYARFSDPVAPIINSIAIIFGAVVFFVLFILLLAKFGNFVKPRHAQLLAKSFGLVVALYGLSYIVRAF